MGLKLIFMGTPEFAVPILKSIHESEHEILCVYTQPPTKKNRGQKIFSSPIQQYAESSNLKLRSPKEFNDEEFIFEISIKNGADDILQDENNFIIICKVKDLDNMKKSFLASDIKIISSEIDLIPKVLQKVEINHSDKLNNLLESLSTHDDISKVYSNQKL